MEGWYEDVEDYDHVSDLVMAFAKALGKFAGASLIGLDLASDTYPPSSFFRPRAPRNSAMQAMRSGMSVDWAI